MNLFFVLGWITVFCSVTSFGFYFTIRKEDEEMLYRKYGLHNAFVPIAVGLLLIGYSIIFITVGSYLSV